MAKVNKGPVLLTVTIVCYALAFIGTALRVYVRQTLVGSLGLDDWLIITSLGLYSMYVSFVMVGIHYGTGQHHADLMEDDILMAVRYWYFCEWAYVITLTVLKMGIGFFYLRLMVSRWQKLIVKWIMATVLVFGVSYFACVVAQCVPVPHIWNRFADSFESQGGCLPHGIVLGGTYIHSIISTGSDWILGLLPIAMLWNVRLGIGIKIIVSFILGLGALASTATMVRIGVIHHITEVDDFLWDTFDIAIWSTVEPGIALFACGLAALRPLLRSLFPSHFRNLHLRSTATNPTIRSPPFVLVEDPKSRDLGGEKADENPKHVEDEYNRTRGSKRNRRDNMIEEDAISRGSREITICISQAPKQREITFSHMNRLPHPRYTNNYQQPVPPLGRSASHLSNTSREITVILDERDVPPVPSLNARNSSHHTSGVRDCRTSFLEPPTPTTVKSEKDRDRDRERRRKSRQRDTWNTICSVVDFVGDMKRDKGKEKDLEKGEAGVENKNQDGDGREDTGHIP